MATAYLGLEIGNNRLKLAEIKGEEIHRFLCVDIPAGIVENGMIRSFAAMKDFLSLTLKENKIKTKKTCLVLPENAVFSRKIKMPYMTVSQLDVNLPYEFKDYLTEDKSQYIFDYALTGLDKNDDGKVISMDLIGVAITKELMERYKQLCKDCGLKLVQALPVELAISNAIDVISPDTANKDYAILDIGYTGSRINIYSNGIFDTNREIEQGCQTLAQKLAELMNIHENIASRYLADNPQNVMESEEMRDACDEIAIQVMRAVNYYTYEKRDNTLDTLYVCGGGAKILQLVSVLEETVPLEVKLLSDLSDDQEAAEGLLESPAVLGACWNDEE